ncbi:MAG: phosphotransferase enzyme family protein [Steroidobacteraceae bacterium]
MNVKLADIFGRFAVDELPCAATLLTSGHINQTWRVDTTSGASYVLQRLSPVAFPDPDSVMANKLAVTRHLSTRAAAADAARPVPRFLALREGGFLLRDEDGGAWNLMPFIGPSRSYLAAPDVHIAREAGLTLGEFLSHTSDLDPTLLNETLPGFHDLGRRLGEFDVALASADAGRRNEAAQAIRDVGELRESMLVIERLRVAGVIPPRVTHNDTKLPNMLFTPEGKGLCMIDLDTVMPGILHYDFGDAVRMLCNTGAEDEPDPDRIGIRLDYFEAFIEGMFGGSRLAPQPGETTALADSPAAMAFIVGLRMLTDFLEGDRYFTTAYPGHNLVRARAQLALAGRFTEARARLEDALESALQSAADSGRTG